MKFFKIFSKKKLVLINVFLFTYLIINFFDGERGIVSFYQNVNLKDKLIKEKKYLREKINIYETKNKLLNEDLDLDYLEILYRSKFMVGKQTEEIYLIKNEN